MVYGTTMVHPLNYYFQTKGIKKADFAKTLGIDPAYLSNILSYRRFPGKKLAKKIQDKTDGEIIWHEILFEPVIEGKK